MKAIRQVAEVVDFGDTIRVEGVRTGDAFPSFTLDITNNGNILDLAFLEGKQQAFKVNFSRQGISFTRAEYNDSPCDAQAKKTMLMQHRQTGKLDWLELGSVDYEYWSIFYVPFGHARSGHS